VDKDTGEAIVAATVEWAATTAAELGERSPEEFLEEYAVDIGATNDNSGLVVPVCGRVIPTSFNDFIFDTEGDLLLLRLQSAERTDIVSIRTDQQYSSGVTYPPAFLEIASDTLDVAEVYERAGCQGRWETALDVADELNSRDGPADLGCPHPTRR
jgi:hypothetical protein